MPRFYRHIELTDDTFYAGFRFLGVGAYVGWRRSPSPRAWVERFGFGGGVGPLSVMFSLPHAGSGSVTVTRRARWIWTKRFDLMPATFIRSVTA